MENYNKHHITKLQFQFELESKPQFHDFADLIQGQIYSEFQRKVDRLLEEFDHPDSIIAFDHIELDLGPLIYEELEEHLVDKILEALRIELYKSLKTNYFDKPGFTSNSFTVLPNGKTLMFSGKSNRINQSELQATIGEEDVISTLKPVRTNSVEDDFFQLLQCYLELGILPYGRILEWDKLPENWEAYFIDLSSETKHQLQATLTTPPVLKRALLHLPISILDALLASIAMDFDSKLVEFIFPSFVKEYSSTIHSWTEAAMAIRNEAIGSISSTKNAPNIEGRAPNTKDSTEKDHASDSLTSRISTAPDKEREERPDISLESGVKKNMQKRTQETAKPEDSPHPQSEPATDKQPKLKEIEKEVKESPSSALPPSPVQFHTPSAQGDLDGARASSNWLIPIHSDTQFRGIPIYIQNAGLVLIWPFISLLFDKLGLLDKEKTFKNSEVASKGAYILEYACRKNMKIGEQDLVLNKLLCGIPIQTALLLPPILDQEEEALIDEMLQAVIQYWSTLKSTPVDGLREAFLMREGKLELHGSIWILTVAQQSYDLLLDDLTWPINTIQLPWMQNELKINWR